MHTDWSTHDDSEPAPGGCHDTGHPAAGDPPSYLDSRMSRAQLLQALGGGVAFMLTAGALQPLAAQAAAPSLTAEPNPGPKEADYLCLIVLDGGRPDYISQNLSVLPNLRSLLRRARWYSGAWVGDLMSITPPGHAVIGTGSFPKNDGGIVNWDWGIHSTGKISPTTQAVANYQNGWVYNLMKDSGTPTLADAFQQPHPADVAVQRASDIQMGGHVNALIGRARHDISLAQRGLLPNTVPADEQPVIHWKRRLALTAAGIGVLGGTGAGLGKAVAAIRRQGTNLSWEE